ncbi:hypothetical protein ACFFKU_07440 [Kineococcus gynurae]|uniref:YjbR protein n=1 Tax=Kineococcus gynurae TaxID=452979 RepID=A0ABV5LWM4_9ACTN
MSEEHLDLDGFVAAVTALPEVGETTTWGHRAWAVAGRKFAWVRPLTKADQERFRAADPPVEAPTGPLVALVTEDLGEKAAVLAEERPGFFDIEHFARFAGYLVALDAARADDVRDALTAAWQAKAPARLRP